MDVVEGSFNGANIYPGGGGGEEEGGKRNIVIPFNKVQSECCICWYMYVVHALYNYI